MPECLFNENSDESNKSSQISNYKRSNNKLNFHLRRWATFQLWVDVIKLFKVSYSSSSWHSNNEIHLNNYSSDGVQDFDNVRKQSHAA